MTTYRISAPAAHAARLLMRNFELVPKPGCRVQPTEKNLAILIDVSTQIFRVENVLNFMVTQVPWLDKNELARNLDLLREAVRAVELVRNRLPHFGGTAAEQKEIEMELTRSQRNHLQQVSHAVAAARTPAEEQDVLQRAGIVRVVQS